MSEISPKVGHGVIKLEGPFENLIYMHQHYQDQYVTHPFTLDEKIAYLMHSAKDDRNTYLFKVDGSKLNSGISSTYEVTLFEGNNEAQLRIFQTFGGINNYSDEDKIWKEFQEQTGMTYPGPSDIYKFSEIFSAYCDSLTNSNHKDSNDG